MVRRFERSCLEGEQRRAPLAEHDNMRPETKYKTVPIVCYLSCKQERK